MNIQKTVLLAAASLGAMLSGVAHAQTMPAPGAAPVAAPGATQDSNVADIVVTANRREERLQKVPVAVSVVQGTQLVRQNINEIGDLTRSVPALNIAGPYGAFSIRGVGSVSFSRSSEGSVGVVVDGVALANTSNNAPQLFDVSRIEVLSGPQGTLFGRNSSAGVLNIVTNAPDPSKIEVIAHVDIGSRDNQIARAVVNLPTSANSALRISGSYSNSPQNQYDIPRKSWYQNEDKSVRARFKWDPSDAITLNLIGDYSRFDRGGGSPWTIYTTTPGGLIASVLAACGVTVGPNNDKGCTDAETSAHDTVYGFSGQVDARFGDYTVTAISAYRAFREQGVGQDADSLPLNILDQNYSPANIRNFSQELRLTSPSKGFITFLAGLYFFDSKLNSGNIQSGMLGTPYLFGQDTATHSSSTSTAAFGQATVNVTPQFRVVVGARVGHENVTADTRRMLVPGAVAPLPGVNVNAAISGHTTDTYLSYRGGVQYDLTGAIMAYATYTRGYKGPAVNDQATTASVPLIVRPEIPKAVELGLKSSFLNGRVAANLALFHTRVDDFQAQFFDATSAQFIFGNAPKLTSKGVSLDIFGQVTHDLSVNAGVLYNDARYGQGYVLKNSPGTVTADAGGNRLVGTPQWKLTASGEYRHAIGLHLQGFVQADVVYTSKINFDAVTDPVDTVNSAAIFGGRLGVRTRDERFGIAVFARNLFDTHRAAVRFANPLGAALGDPASFAQIYGPESFRVIGVSLDARF